MASPNAPEGVLFIDNDVDERRRLQPVLTPLARVVSRGELGADPAAEGFGLVLVNFDALSDEERAALKESFARRPLATPLVLLSDGRCRPELVELLERHAVTNLVARTGREVDLAELALTAKKILSRDIFGLRPCLGSGALVEKATVSRSGEIEAVLARVEQFAQGSGASSRLAAQLGHVAEELLTNALYNAPVAPDGTHRFASWSRAQPVELAPGEAIEVELCADGRLLGLVVSDSFGSLAPEVALDYLAKGLRKGDDQVDRKEGGAGLGLYLAFEALSRLVINVQRGHRTEFIGILDLRGSYKDFAARAKSFHLFVAS